MKSSVISLIGRTPLVRLGRMEEYFGLKAGLYAKLEGYNPSGSVKDRAAIEMLTAAMGQGLSQGSVIIEPTSGNLGISLAMLSASLGLRAIILMPENMSKERASMIRSYGAEVVPTPAEEGMQGAIDRAAEMTIEIKNGHTLGQFTNKNNESAHYKTTAWEIFNDIFGRVDILVAGVGSGGTISGVARFLKERLPSVKVVAVEPLESAVLSGGRAGRHGIAGIGAGFLPPLFRPDLVDEVMTVHTDAAIAARELLARREGIAVGISSGAALTAAVSVAKRAENKGKNIVVIFPDRADRYGYT